MAARSERFTAAARAPICRSDCRDESKCTPSTSMSQQTTNPPSSTAASSPMPTTRPSPVPATARMRSTSSSSGSMGGNVPAVLLRLRLYHPAGRHLSAPEQIRELSGPPRGRPFLLEESMTLPVAHFGEEGAYAAEAAGRMYPEAELVACHSIPDVVRAVTRGDAGCGVLPIENSLAGVVPETYDVLAHAPLSIIDETVLAVPHVLVGLPGTNIDALARIHSHPMALTQCRRFLSSLPDTLPEVAPSTAGAARRVAESGDARQAAISSRWVAGHTRIDRAPGEDWRCAIRFVTHHHPGALHDAIEPLRRYGVNMSSLQSRPIPGRPWDYQFYADLEGHPLDAAVGEALREMEGKVAQIAYLGCYPAHPRP